MTEKRIIRHYRLYSGDIACGRKIYSEATSAEEGVTCKQCIKALQQMKETIDKITKKGDK